MDLDPEYQTLLVFGGSKGARSINNSLLESLPELLKRFQVIHISGKLDYEDIRERTDHLGGELKTRYRLFPYLHGEMGAALRCADLVVSRAGASILGEYPRFRLPAIVVPYPHAWDYQLRNARYLEKLGAAEILLDQDLDQELHQRVNDLLEDPVKLNQMSDAMGSASKPEAASYLASWLKLLGGIKPEVRSV
jgi:UDP-N-acetylglucosamine--N-acetylmuramyl-(pentapeptide) pyrophosphoryl-undecaprenol N-acetylglucosamine transferase